MDEARDHISQHVSEISARTHPEGEELLTSMIRRCWSSAGSDRTEPVALEWVRRWGPAHAAVDALECSCAAGRCAVCN